MSQRKTAEEILKESVLSAHFPDGTKVTEDQYKRGFEDPEVDGPKFHEAFVSAMKEYAKQELEARDELIKELAEALESLITNAEFSPKTPVEGRILQQSRLLAKEVLTKAQSFNQE